MPVIGRRLNDHVDVLALEDAAEVGELFRRLAGGAERFRRAGRVRLVGVADRDDVAEPCGIFCVADAHSAATDEGYAGSVIGRRRRRRLGRGGQLAFDEPHRQARRGSDGGAIPEERPAGDIESLGHGPIERQSPARRNSRDRRS